MIKIYTGRVHTGKTTALRKWCKERKDVGGFLTPDIEGLRMFQDIKSNEILSFQLNNTEPGQTIEVGTYIFKKSIFQYGNEIIEEQIQNSSIDYIIIDELGKLEMKGEGFSKAASLISANYMKKNFIIVVRDFLVHSVAQKYNFPSYTVVENVKEL